MFRLMIRWLIYLFVCVKARLGSIACWCEFSLMGICYVILCNILWVLLCYPCASVQPKKAELDWEMMFWWKPYALFMDMICSAAAYQSVWGISTHQLSHDSFLSEWSGWLIRFLIATSHEWGWVMIYACFFFFIRLYRRCIRDLIPCKYLRCFASMLDCVVLQHVRLTYGPSAP